MPSVLSNLASAYAALGKFDDAWRCVGEAMTMVETTKEKSFEAAGAECGEGGNVLRACAYPLKDSEESE